jgi:hypothetical protein
MLTGRRLREADFAEDDVVVSARMRRTHRCGMHGVPGAGGEDRDGSRDLALDRRKVVSHRAWVGSGQPQRLKIGFKPLGRRHGAILAACYPDLFAAVAVHSGLAYNSATSMSSAFEVMARGAGDADAQG